MFRGEGLPVSNLSVSKNQIGFVILSDFEFRYSVKPGLAYNPTLNNWALLTLEKDSV